MAKNRYSWKKRVKEIARKQKKEEKMKRRQNKAQAKREEDVPEMMAQDGQVLDENSSDQHEASGEAILARTE